ncbi:hypothetical protein GF342_05470 [Candidatus Woesearchaeota archaeon]|nr:hypothetical protein [Candidatus Woesearchaeota archaeon]
MKEALGKKEGHTIKVDQAGGSNGDLDRQRLQEFISRETLKDSFVLFVDSTVDSGRQIQVLRRYFDDNEWRKRIGHKDWGIVGSNENGFDHYKHRNINWGLNPDESFEDNPRLMGVDYLPGSRTTTIECPCHLSKRIKKALLEVPRGTILDTSDLSELVKIKKAYAHYDRIVRSKTWTRAIEGRDERKIVLPPKNTPEMGGAHATLLVIGDGRQASITGEEIIYLVNSLGATYNAIAGTAEGNPGALLDQWGQVHEGNAQLYQPRYKVEQGVGKECFGNQISFHGETKPEFRENLVQSADAVLALGGRQGTLRETVLAAHAGKPVYVVKGFGAVGRYLSKHHGLQKMENVHVVSTLPEAVRELLK